MPPDFRLLPGGNYEPDFWVAADTTMSVFEAFIDSRDFLDWSDPMDGWSVCSVDVRQANLHLALRRYSPVSYLQVRAAVPLGEDRRALLEGSMAADQDLSTFVAILRSVQPK
jgi:hypothetical protein